MYVTEGMCANGYWIFKTRLATKVKVEFVLFKSVLCYLCLFALTLDVTANVLLVKDGGRDVTDKSGVALRLKTDRNPS